MVVENKQVLSIEDMATFCKKKGFVDRSADIYGGFAGFWDYLFLGAELKGNMKDAWWSFFVRGREDIEGIDGSIITHPDVWKASGHVDNFSDVFVTCLSCKKDGKVDRSEVGKVKCDYCGGDLDWENTKDVKQMLKTNIGKDSFGYLRPETAQLIFANFKAVFDGARMKLPCGIAQMGKAFRNEIAPRNFLFRCREFEQMEIEYFVKPGEGCPYDIADVEVKVLADGWTEVKTMSLKKAFAEGIIAKDWHAYWLGQSLSWFRDLGANLDNFRILQHEKAGLAHYASDCWDLEYNFPFGWKELQGIADRGDFDLAQHEKASKQKLGVFDDETKERFLPHVVCEPSFGVERALLVFLYEAYTVNEKGNVILKLSPKLAPIKAAIFPLMKKGEQADVAHGIYDGLKKRFNVNYDVSGSVGRRYARNDEIGTPFCITIDDESLTEKTVTVRDRDTAEQKRVKIDELRYVLGDLVSGEKSFSDL
ncbi:MAG: glycine--tRNA ligase [Nanoarchaeota archaeon]|jgi:glycyl-tRNA synthetase|nr:glycine--tRNA ligase [Nanoarchaeota archaeon]